MTGLSLLLPQSQGCSTIFRKLSACKLWPAPYNRPMAADYHRLKDVGAGAALFATTHWSAVLAAGHPSSPEGQQALEQLCRTYWYPLYVFLRRERHSPEDAQDLVQGFFLHLLRREVLQTVERDRGRFRSFLLGTFKHFLSDQRRRGQALKRGGGQQFISLDLVGAEGRFQSEALEAASADQLFDRRWAVTILEQALERLRSECAADGRIDVFEQLKSFVTGARGPSSYAEAGARLGLGAGAVKSAIFRLRHRYHELVREEVAHTVAAPEEVEDELRYMVSLFNRGT